jgi:hypothetical protein
VPEPRERAQVSFDGTLLAGRWRLGPRLAHGAQADTYLARDDEAGGRVVVVKQLRLAQRAGWKPFELFEREVRVLRSLDHPGIPRHLDSFESEPGVFNLVMERAPGATLWAYSKKVRFADAELRDILVKSLEILSYLHRLSPPVVHRDIKPHNLVRAADGHVSLVDFGGVKDALRAEGGSTVIGTFGYMAPEQLHGEATPATDLYGLGATMVALAGGCEPEKVPRRGLRMDLDRHLAHLEPRLRGAIAAMVEPDPDHRPASATAVLAMLSATSRPVAGGSRSASLIAGAARTSVLAGRPRETPRHEVIARVVDEIAEFQGEMPAALRPLVHVLIFLVGASAYIGVTLLRLMLLPIAFAIASAAAPAARRPRVREVRGEIEAAVDETRAGLRAISFGRRLQELPPPRE